MHTPATVQLQGQNGHIYAMFMWSGKDALLCWHSDKIKTAQNLATP